jgi:hypothetical protein
VYASVGEVDAYACVQEEEEEDGYACAKEEDGSAYSDREEEDNAYARVGRRMHTPAGEDLDHHGESQARSHVSSITRMKRRFQATSTARVLWRM